MNGDAYRGDSTAPRRATVARAVLAEEDDLHFPTGPLGKIHARMGRDPRGSGPGSGRCRCCFPRPL